MAEQPRGLGARVLVTAFLLGVATAVAVHALASGGEARGAPARTVSVREHPELGPILVGPTGFTLYVYERDPVGRSTCTDGCASNWPPLLAAGAPLADPVLPGALGLIRRAAPDGRTQVTYRGRPLHRWSRDGAPGEAGGHGAGGVWAAALP